MPEGKLNIIKDIIDNQYGLLLLMSIWAGTAKYLSELKGSKVTLLGWATEAIISGFVGVITALICEHYQIPLVLSAAIVGISAHNGTRSLYFISVILKKRLK